MNNKLKLSLVAAMMLGTCAVADTKVSIGGDAEVKYQSVKEGSSTNAHNTTEVNLGIEAEMKSGTKLVTEFVVFDGTQADSTAGNTADMTTKQAYVAIPLPNGFKLQAGLAANGIFGTDAFDGGGESWKTVVSKQVNKDLKVTLVEKKIKEMQANDGKGDSDQTVLQVNANAAGLTIGAKVAKTVKNKDVTGTEDDTTTLNAFLSGEAAGIGYTVEYVSESGDNKGKGFIVAGEKGINDKLTASAAYVSLTDGKTGGGEFAPGSFFDGNVDSSTAKDTSAAVVGLGYTYSDAVSTSATFISADVLGKSATEFVLGAEYALNSDVTVAVEYANASGDGVDALTTGAGDDKVTNMSVALTTSF